MYFALYGIFLKESSFFFFLNFHTYFVFAW